MENKALQRWGDGYLANINKPSGWTSFDVVRKVRRITGIRKVGHAGTLDPFATGVLLVAFGKATKRIGTLMEEPKEYVAELVLGKATDTMDVTGKVVEEKPVPAFSARDLEAVLQKFVGRIQQQIPAFAASRINGRRRYELARQGKEVPPAFKTVEIYHLEVLDFTATTIRFRTVCGRGTYIRTLGADLARELGTVGFLNRLTRTRIGAFTLESALDLTEFEKEWENLIVDEGIS